MKQSLLFFSVIISFIAKAQQNFEPCSNIYTEPIWLSESRIKQIQQFFTSDDYFIIEASLLIDPSRLCHDKIIELVRHAKTKEYKLIYKKAIYSDDNETQIEHQEKVITLEEAIIIKNLFIIALIHVEYQPTKIGVKDGTFYYLQSNFWGIQNGLCGFTQSPTSEKITRFINLNQELIKFILSNQTELPKQLNTDLIELTNKFNKKELNLKPPTLEDVLSDKEFNFFEKE